MARNEIALRPSDDYNRIAREAPANTDFHLEGVYPEWSVRPANGQRFYGHGKTLLDGTIKLGRLGDATWRDDGGGVFSRPEPGGHSWDPGSRGSSRVYETTTPFFKGSLAPDTVWGGTILVGDIAGQGDNYPEVLQPTTRRPERWQWQRGGGRLYVNAERGLPVYLTGSREAFDCSDRNEFAQDVHLYGLTVRGYKSRSQHGVVQLRITDRSYLEDCEVSFNWGGGLDIGRELEARRCVFLMNGHLGGHGFGSNTIKPHDTASVTFRDCEFLLNGFSRFDRGWEQAGLKMVRTWGLVIDGGTFALNQGDGVWLDWDNAGGVIQRIISVLNGGTAIHHEAGYGICVESSILVRNNQDGGALQGSYDKPHPDSWTTNIRNESSSHTRYSGCTLEGSRFPGYAPIKPIDINAISIGGGTREAGQTMRGCEVRDNTVLWPDAGEGPLFSQHSDYYPLAVSGNKHFCLQGQAGVRRFARKGDRRSFADAQRHFGWDENGSMTELSATAMAERDRLGGIKLAHRGEGRHFPTYAANKDTIALLRRLAATLR